MLILSFLGGMKIARGMPPPGNACEVTGFVSQKSRALLAYLALNPRPHARDVLAGLLWSEMPQQRAAGNLRVVLSNLRDLFPEYLSIEQHTVAFDATCPYWLDVAAFETLLAAGDLDSLQQATALYRGLLLEGVYLHGAPAFEEWLLVERERLHQAQTQALHRLAWGYTTRGDYAAAIAAAERLLALDPWREETHRALMELLALTGQRSAALAQYEQCRRLLRAELGLEPLEETTALYERIRADTFLSPSHSHSLSSSSPLPFVGRGAEYATLMAWWENVRRGERKLMLVEGEAGVGKTRLVEELLRVAEAQGTTVLRGCCYEFGGGLPYQSIAAALRTQLHRAPPPLPPSWRVELTRLLPELRATASEAPPQSDEAGRQRLFEAVKQFLESSASCPLPPSPFSLSLSSLPPASCLLFLDDLHWADPSTLDLLYYLARAEPAVPLGLIGTYRPEEMPPGHPLTRLRQSLSRDGRVQWLHLTPLSAAAVTELACGLVGRQDAAALGDWLYRESEGNPFILTEIVYALQELDALHRLPAVAPLPASVQDVILQRVERLSLPAQQLLGLAAVIGRRFDAAFLQMATPTADVAAIIDEWFSRCLVTPISQSPIPNPQSLIPHPQFLDFTHDKIRAVVYAAISVSQRQTLHRQVAEAFEQTYEIGEQAGWLAYHWEQAAEPARAVEYLLRAGDYARLLYAEEEAAAYYRRALAYLEEQGEAERAARTWMKLGLTYHNAFDFAAARRAYTAAFALWQRSASRALTPPSQTLRVRWEEPRSLDPIAAPDDHTSNLIANLFSGLVEINAEMAVVPDVAQRWEISRDGRTFTFYLRADARWSDGIPVTAEDFICAWRRALDPANGLLASGSMAEIVGAEVFHAGRAPWEGVGIRARGPLTLEVELQEPSGYFLYLLAHTPYYPIPCHLVETCGAAWSAPEHFISNGPFILEHWERGKWLALRRHTGYHGVFSGNLERVELHFLPEPETRLDWYTADKLDVLGITHFPTATQTRARRRHAEECLVIPRLAVCYLVFDVRRAPFDDVRVRQAFALATDREALADDVLQGCVVPATGGFTPQGVPGHVPGVAQPYAPERARQLLAAAGYADGRSFPTVRALAFRAVEARVAYLQAQWHEQLGVEIAWEVLEWPDFLARLRQTSSELFIAIWVADYPDPDNFLRVSRADHWDGWRHVEYEALVEQARRDLNQAARLARYAQAERILATETPVLPLTYEREHLLLKPWVRRYPFSGGRAGFWKDAVLEVCGG